MTLDEVMQALHTAMDALAPLENILPTLPPFAGQTEHFAHLQQELTEITADLHCARLDLGSVAHRLDWFREGHLTDRPPTAEEQPS